MATEDPSIYKTLTTWRSACSLSGHGGYSHFNATVFQLQGSQRATANGSVSRWRPEWCPTVVLGTGAV